MVVHANSMVEDNHITFLIGKKSHIKTASLFANIRVVVASVSKLKKIVTKVMKYYR